MVKQQKRQGYSLRIDLHPFAVIRDDELNFTVVEKRVTRKGKPVETTLGYYASLADALIRIATEMQDRKVSTITLREYIQQLRFLLGSFTEKINGKEVQCSQALILPEE